MVRHYYPVGARVRAKSARRQRQRREDTNERAEKNEKSGRKKVEPNQGGKRGDSGGKERYSCRESSAGRRLKNRENP